MQSGSAVLQEIEKSTIAEIFLTGSLCVLLLIPQTPLEIMSTPFVNTYSFSKFLPVLSKHMPTRPISSVSKNKASYRISSYKPCRHKTKFTKSHWQIKTLPESFPRSPIQKDEKDKNIIHIWKKKKIRSRFLLTLHKTRTGTHLVSSTSVLYSDSSASLNVSSVSPMVLSDITCDINKPYQHLSRLKMCLRQLSSPVRTCLPGLLPGRPSLPTLPDPFYGKMVNFFVCSTVTLWCQNSSRANRTRNECWTLQEPNGTV